MSTIVRFTVEERKRLQRECQSCQNVWPPAKSEAFMKLTEKRCVTLILPNPHCDGSPEVFRVESGDVRDVMDQNVLHHLEAPVRLLRQREEETKRPVESG